MSAAIDAKSGHLLRMKTIKVPQHSPLPWRTVIPQFEDSKGIPWIGDDEGRCIAQVFLIGDSESHLQAVKNADFITYACNNFDELVSKEKSHAELLAALKEARPTLRYSIDEGTQDWRRETRQMILARVDAAIAKAEGRAQ